MTTGGVALLRKLFRNRLFSATVFFVEEKSKEFVFGCQSCGQCVLSHTGYVCPMRCPKQMRNGPCGGFTDRHCEVNPAKLCAWIEIWESTSQLERARELLDYEEPLDWRLYGTSSWENLVESRITNMKFFKGPQALLKQILLIMVQFARNWYRLVTGKNWRPGEALHGKPA